MRTTTMTDGDHGALVAKLRAERADHLAAIALAETSERRGWAGVPAENRRRVEEALPARRAAASSLTDWIDALLGATTH